MPQPGKNGNRKSPYLHISSSVDMKNLNCSWQTQAQLELTENNVDGWVTSVSADLVWATEASLPNRGEKKGWHGHVVWLNNGGKRKWQFTLTIRLQLITELSLYLLCFADSILNYFDNQLIIIYHAQMANRGWSQCEDKLLFSVLYLCKLEIRYLVLDCWSDVI